MRESKVEKSVVNYFKEEGGIAYKFVSPGRRGVPDRIGLLPIHEKHRAIVNRYVKFIECKAPGGRLEPWQKREQERLKSMGFETTIVDRSVK